MNNVDLSIKYLSGEMSREEAGSFENELASHFELKEQFEDVSDAYDLIRDQLVRRDEEAFRNKLREIMERPAVSQQSLAHRKRPGWYFLLALAGSLAILLAVYLINQGSDRIISRYFHPEKDPVILAYNQETRGATESGIFYYHQGLFQKSMVILSELSNREPENNLVLLYYLLASMELDLQDQALVTILNREWSTDHHLGQALTWYATLALIKSGREDEARAFLLPLTEQQGPYQSDARHLTKILLK